MFLDCIPLCLREEYGCCVVCLKQCRSKGCRCSYFHKQCMHQMLKNGLLKCVICDKKFSSWWLDAEPKLEEKELMIIRKSERIKFEKDRNKKMLLTAYFTFVAPILIKMYPYVFDSRNIYEMILIEDVCEDERMANSFYQRCMDNGLGSVEASKAKDFLLRVHNEYDTYSYNIKKRIHKIFVKSLSELKKRA